MGTLWFGGTIYTLRKDHEKVEAVYVEGNKVVALGSKQNLESTYQPLEYVDLHGAVMYPGFVDSHMHVIGHGEKLIKLDFSEMTSSMQIMDALKERVNQAEANEWIISVGWNENALDDQKIFHCNELDEISPQNPLIIQRICRHALIANSKALELAGITKDTENPAGGVIVRDGDGNPTGYLLDDAQELVKRVIPQVSETNALRESIKDCHRLGLVGAHTEDLNYYGGFNRTYRSFLKVINQEKLPFKANLLVHHEVVEDMAGEDIHFGEETGYVEIGAMKIFADGALGGRTALLSYPYNDDSETSGVAIYELPKLKELVKKARKYKMPVAVHAIGDLAFEYIVEAIEEYPPLPGQRDRLIHAQILRKDLIERVKKLPVVLDIQPRFVAADFPWVLDRIGEERMEYCYAWKTLLNEGLACSGGSDAPIEPVDPLLGIHAAITRRHPNDAAHICYYPNQKLTRYEAIKLFTSGSAFAINHENDRGVIDVGFDADFTILEHDILTIPADQILHTKVKMTVVDGKVVYEASQVLN